MQSKIRIWTPSGEVPFVHSTFPAGEEYVKLTRLAEIRTALFAVIYIDDATSSTIMTACLLADAIRQEQPKVHLVANFSYLPYGRQDRACSPGESYSLRFFIRMLQLDFNYVQAIDLHSKAESAQITEIPKPKDWLNVRTRKVSDQAFHLPTSYVAVAPDKGAFDRVQGHEKVIHLSKTRKDGKISLCFEEDSYVQLVKDNNEFVIFDDICDGGGTFIAALKRIQEINPKAVVYLVVTHGIFSKGLDILNDFKEIIVADTNYNRLRLK